METCFTLAPPAGSDGPTLQWSGKRLLQTAAIVPRAASSVTAAAKGRTGFLGDHAVLRHLLRDYRGAVDLIYIDPPYNSGAAYTRPSACAATGRRAAPRSAVTTTLCPPTRICNSCMNGFCWRASCWRIRAPSYVQLDAHRAPLSA